MLASTGVAEVLLVLKIAFLVLLYLFVVRVIRSAGRERQAPSQDSMILTPGAAAAAGLGRGASKRRSVRLVVQRSPSFEVGDEFPLNSAPLTVGRGGQNDLVLDGDEFASARHARIEVRGDGVWVRTWSRRTARSSTARASRARSGWMRATSCASARPTSA